MIIREAMFAKTPTQGEPELKVVHTLRGYKRPLPLTFLADVLNQSVAETNIVIKRLERDAIVKLEDGNVRLLME